MPGKYVLLALTTGVLTASTATFAAVSHAAGAARIRAAASAVLPQKKWWAQQDSNLQPDGYEPSALTN
jgi:hypothetical protein